MAEREYKTAEDQIAEALQREDLPEIYFNGFTTAFSNADFLIVLKRYDKPIAVLNASYTIAKTLSQKIGAAVAQLEERTGNTIMTTDDIERTAKGEPDAGE